MKIIYALGFLFLSIAILIISVSIFLDKKPLEGLVKATFISQFNLGDYQEVKQANPAR